MTGARFYSWLVTSFGAVQRREPGYNQPGGELQMVKKKAVIYAREVANVDTDDDEPTLYLLDKWKDFDEALQAEADVIAVAFPEVLGDHYSELIVNLGKLANNGKTLKILKPSPFMVYQRHIKY